MALLFGVHENGDPAATVQRLGGAATRPFTGGVVNAQDLIKPIRAACQDSWRAGLTAVWSVKPHPADVTSGAWRPYFDALARYLKAHPELKTIVVIWHEPENDVPTWFRDAAAFVKLFDTCAGWMRAAHPGIVLAHAALAYRYGDTIKAGITDDTAPAWRTSADLHCVDVYSGRSNPLATTLPELSSFRRWKKYVARDSAWGVTERGWAAGPHDSALRAATIAREGAYLAQNPPAVYLVWNTPGTENDPKLVLDAAGERAVQGLMLQLAAQNAAVGAVGTPVDGRQAAAPDGVTVSHTVPCPLCAGTGKYSFTLGGT